MKRPFFAGFLIILVVFLAFGSRFFGGKSQENDIFGKISKYTGEDPSGYRGNYFILHFWAKWCAPCTEEIPHLVEFAKKTDKEIKNLKILAVSLDESLETSKSILPKQGQDLPPNFFLFLDSKQALAEELGSYQYPETYLFDPQGKILEKWVGPQRWDRPNVIEFFRKITLSNP